jgi:hypothetical protein
MGFDGMTYNDEGNGLLDIDLVSAGSAGVTILRYPGYLDVYQHNSPGVHMFFYGEEFNITPSRITGMPERAEYTTDPISDQFGIGNVSGSIRAVLLSLVQKVVIHETLALSATPEIAQRFSDCLAPEGLSLNDVAYTLDVNKGNFSASGAANVTLTVAASWVSEHGGVGAVHIIRTSHETGTTEMIDTYYLGTDPAGDMVFRGDSPQGSSLFGLVSAQAAAAEQKARPNETFIPASKPAMSTSIGMFGWILDLMLNNPLLVGIVIALIAAAAYLGWWRRRLGPRRDPQPGGTMP